MRTLARIGIIAVIVAGLGWLAASAVATPELPQLPVSDLLTPAGRMTTLRGGTAYGASEFPLALRLTAPDRSWSGAQWKAGLFPPDEIKRRHLRCPVACRGPFFGWAALGQGSTSLPPRGLILIVSAYARTSSVAATVAGLRTRGHGATYQGTSPVKLAGFSGIQFDGEVVGRQHTFVPFTPPSSAAGREPDAYTMSKSGEVFRIIVQNVRGKTVVVYLESLMLPADEFPAFLIKASDVLETLRFPG